MHYKKLMIGASLMVALGLFAACSGDNSTQETKESSTKTTESSVDLNKLELPQLNGEVTDDEYLVELVTTKGNIKIKLFPEQAPKAVENFVTHAKDGYYNDTTFHRVIQEFMIQGGDPKGDGTGGESIWKKGFKTEDSNQLYNIRGALSMARSSSRSSNGSQFFIVTNKDDVSDGLPIQYYPEKIIERYKDGGAPNLDGEYTVFGQVTEGLDIVDQIASGEVKDNGSGEKSTPTDPVKVTEIKVLQEPKK
ncbi:peptidylprolyl isomerase [Enterococcus xiangfangensis]|uniref:peptidylprolyl isomerase n=1 Tax=Enterococcus xiangfangensis TaxID=1296537 RepID=UPI0010F8BD4E|nr:peptidylprolyl isomerase [Enterococcus xiangfangensis]MBM7711850.1 peptidyl-prolyl cis-trans isomerase A (cyclophilin A) [Enterococcus xiangfangensis]NBK07424.1 peptidylprolyl isomerase [Enterococcus asini]